MLKRIQSSKLVFYDIVADGVKLQVLADLRSYASESEFATDVAFIKRGDIIGVCGHPCSFVARSVVALTRVTLCRAQPVRAVASSRSCLAS